MTIARKLSVVLFVLFLASPALAAPLPPGTLGGQLYSTGGDVTVTVLQPEAAFTSDIELFLINPSSTTFVASSKNVGAVVDLGVIPAGQELLFGISVHEEGNQVYKMGPGSRNPDGLIHAIVDLTGPNTARVYFEDLFGNPPGSDRDFNDVIFDVNGSITATPAPPAVALLGIGAFGLGAYRTIRRKRA